MSIIGIDLGTTNSVVAVADGQGSRILKDGTESLIPSVVAFNHAGSVQAVGQRAKTLRELDSDRIAYSIKRLMGKGKKDLEKFKKEFPFDFSPSTDEMLKIQVGGFVYSPIDLSAEILKRCRFVAENSLGHRVSKCVVTVPAYFDDAQRNATVLASKLAGLEVVRIVNEPTAAALAFGIGLDSRDHVVAVFDFGGGTFDISILKVKGEIFEVLSTDGDTQLGGDDLDHALVTLLAKKMGLSNLSKEEFSQLKVQAERVKIAIGVSESIKVSLFLGDHIAWSGDIHRAEVEQCWNPIVQKTLELSARALNASHLSVEEIDHVLMVGGSTRVPLVVSMVGDYFKKIPNNSVNPEEVVALGAAIQGSILSGERKDSVLLDVVPLSLGIETMGGLVSKIIHRNSTVPLSVEEHYTTYADNQTAVDIHVLQGERELVENCRSLGRMKLKIKPGIAGSQKVGVRFSLDANGILSVEATDLKTGQKENVEIKPSFGLDDTTVEKMLNDAWAHADMDFQKRREIEIANQANALIRAVEKSLQSPLLDSYHKSAFSHRLAPIVAALREDLKFGNSDIIAVRSQELDLASKDLAQHIMDKNVQSILTSKSIESVRI